MPVVQALIISEAVGGTVPPGAVDPAFLLSRRYAKAPAAAHFPAEPCREFPLSRTRPALL